MGYTGLYLVYFREFDSFYQLKKGYTIIFYPRKLLWHHQAVGIIHSHSLNITEWVSESVSQWVSYWQALPMIGLGSDKNEERCYIWSFLDAMIPKRFSGYGRWEPLRTKATSSPMQILHKTISLFNVPCGQPGPTIFCLNISTYIEIYLAITLQREVQMTWFFYSIPKIEI